MKKILIIMILLSLMIGCAQPNQYPTVNDEEETTYEVVDIRDYPKSEPTINDWTEPQLPKPEVK